MTSHGLTLCFACARFRSPIGTDNPDGPPTCLAFPDGIPDEVIIGGFDHRQEFPGDGGVRFLLAPGSEATLERFERQSTLAD